MQPSASSSIQKSTVKVKKVENQNLCCLVNQADKMNSKQVIEYLKMLLATEDKVKNPIDEIEAIFNKIQKWK